MLANPRLIIFLIGAVFLSATAATGEDQNDELQDGVKWLNDGFKRNDAQPLVRFIRLWRDRHRRVTDAEL